MFRELVIHLEDDSLVNAVCPDELVIHPGDPCVVECNRVPEFGCVVQLIEHKGEMPVKGTVPFVMRRATLQDQSKAAENSVVGRLANKTVHKRVEEHKLPIHVVQVRYSFDRSVLHITFTSEDRVEYAELLKTLSGELRARVEMKSLGIRDAAKRVGGMGVCGRPLCCKTWMKEFNVVTVKMAKTQRLALNPGAISGTCGRLKCCLKHEFDSYQRVGDKFPKDGSQVKCEAGCGCIWDKDILRERVKVRLDDGRVLDYPLAEVHPVSELAAHKGRKQEK
ncbi:MAG: regulatory iron-sulfur-containing complex subunit RicT [bacterium]